MPEIKQPVDRQVRKDDVAGVEFQNLPMDYHTWGCPVFVLESPLQGDPTGLPKW